MVLVGLSLIPVAILIVVPLIQRISFEAFSWQGQLTQAALWALLPIGILWTLQMLDSGQGVLALLPCVSCLGLLIFGSSGGWPALLSGRLAQGALLLLALLAFYLGKGFMAVAGALILTLFSVTADYLLERVGPAPREPRDVAGPEVAFKSPELTGTLVGARRQDSVVLPAKPPALPLDRPPLPPPGVVSQWTTQQAETAARHASNSQDNFKRGRQLNG